MESISGFLPRRLRALGWAVLFPVVMLVSFVCWGLRPWTWTMYLAAVAVTLVAPAAAADLSHRREGGQQALHQHLRQARPAPIR